MKFPLFGGVLLAVFAAAATVAAVGTFGGTATARGFDSSAGNLTALSDTGGSVTLAHTLDTQHNFIGDPNFFPSGTCRDLAVLWNSAVYQNRGYDTFQDLLSRAAAGGCRVEHTSLDATNELGAFPMVNVKLSR